jgi:hypothetical protein
MVDVTTWDELKLLLVELAADERGPLRGYPMPSVDGGRTPPFQISLAAWAVDVATELDSRFGNDVVLTVGALRFPSRTLQHTRPSPSEDPLLGSDEAEVSLPSDVEVRTGRDLITELRIRNQALTKLGLRTNGKLTAWVLDPTTRAVVGGYSGAQRVPLRIFEVDSGESILVPLLVGTASFDPPLGYAVPPGHWAMEAVLNFGDHQRRTPLLPLLVVP